MRQTGRSYKSGEWLLVLWLLTSASTCAQYASSPYDGQPFYGYNQQLEQQLQPTLYPDVPVTYNRQYPATQSVWSGAPIVVTDEANSLEQQQQQQQQQRGYLPINYYNNGESRRQSDWNSYNYNYNNNELSTTTRAANHNYNNVPGYVYSGQPQQTQLEQRELLAAADSQRDEEQVVRIGGSRSLADSNGNHNSRSHNNNYYEPAQSLQRRDFEAKYLQHYADYLRRFPQRLQPLFNTGPPFNDK